MQTSKDYQGVLRRDSDADVDEFLCHDDNVLLKDVELLSDFSHDK